MPEIKSLVEAETVLARYVPLSKEITGKDLTLERMEPLMKAISNPHKRLKIIHIAGTSGKTSTAYYIAALLTTAGLKTGLTVSPHVDSVLERVQINLQPLSEQEFTKALGEFIDIITAAKINPTYFELLVAFAYWYFEKIGVDYAVIETGLGGLQDATNVADQTDKLCVITDIGFDHMHILGDTLPQIATQKAGIIHSGNTALMYKQSEEITEVFKKWSREHEAQLKTLDQAQLEAAAPAGINSLPNFQKRNWLLALEAYKWLATRDALPELTITQLEKSMKTVVPGRMQSVKIQDKTIILDGAHNEQKIKAFVDSFQQKFPGVYVPVLLSLKQDKAMASVLEILKPITSTLIVTEFTSGQDLPANAIDAAELAAAAKKLGFHEVLADYNQDTAYEKLVTLKSQLAIIVGSFYLLGQLRHNHEELQL